MEQADCDKTSEQADQACQNHEPPVVLAGQAGKYTEHWAADLSLFAKNLADHGFISRYAGSAKLIQPAVNGNALFTLAR
jgi:hypothetical protein